jgi:8-oxo-dGTP diphosphatase
MRHIRVVAAVIRRGDRILVTRRPDGPAGPGQWEFPGGKVEAGEDEPAALRREIAEELGCPVLVDALQLRHRHHYAAADQEVELAFYACRLPEGAEPRCLGVAALEWARGDALADYDFLEADRAVLGALGRPPGPVGPSSSG